MTYQELTNTIQQYYSQNGEDQYSTDEYRKRHELCLRLIQSNPIGELWADIKLRFLERFKNLKDISTNADFTLDNPVMSSAYIYQSDQKHISIFFIGFSFITSQFSFYFSRREWYPRNHTSTNRSSIPRKDVFEQEGLLEVYEQLMRGELRLNDLEFDDPFRLSELMNLRVSFFPENEYEERLSSFWIENLTKIENNQGLLDPELAKENCIPLFSNPAIHQKYLTVFECLFSANRHYY